MPLVLAAALASAPGVGPVALRRLLAGTTPDAAWSRLRSRADGPPLPEPAAVAAALDAAGVSVTHLGDGSYPGELVDDPEPPAVLFYRGALDALHHPRVGIVGTRRCTHYGREVARQLGRDLAAAGVAVVSGLAAGIDGAAHDGVLAAANDGAPPIGIVGSGLDVVYPRTNARLWGEVAARGLLLSEAPLGARPEAWRFPARNRIIAALSDVLVVVESHAVGGSMHTVRAAAERGVTVMAVPGSVRSAASAGTNKLLADGVAPVLDVDDVLVALDLATAGSTRSPAATAGDPVPLEPDEKRVLDAVGWEPTATEAIVARCGLPLIRTTVLLNRLEQRSLVNDGGGWWERR